MPRVYYGLQKKTATRNAQKCAAAEDGFCAQDEDARSVSVSIELFTQTYLLNLKIKFRH